MESQSGSGRLFQSLGVSSVYLVVGLVGLGLPLTATIRVSRVSAVVSVRVSVN